MSLLRRMVASLHTSAAYRESSDLVEQGRDVSLAVPGLVRPLLVASLFAEHPRPVLVAIAGEQAAERFARLLSAYLEPGQVLHFAERREPPWSDAVPDLETVGARARALHALSAGREVVVVASARSLLRALPPQGSHVFEPLVLEVGTVTDPADVAARLARMGYERVETAEERGTFAVRGGVLDVYPSESHHPVRAEFFGDEIETLRRYVPSTGQTIGDAGRTEVFTCREVALSTRATGRVEKTLRDRALREPEIAHHLELMREGVYFNGIERYLPLLYETQGVLTDYLAPNTLIVVAEPRSLFDDATRRHDELTQAAKMAGASVDGLILPPARLDLGGRQRLTLLSLLRAGGAVDAELAARRPDVSGGEEAFIGGVRALTDIDYSVVVAVPDRRARLRVGDMLAHAGLSIAEVPAHDPSDPAAGSSSALASGVVHLAPVEVPAGFVIPEARLAVVSIDDVYPRSAAARRAARDADPRV